MPRVGPPSRRCLETRQRDGMTFRRYELADGSRTTTCELPAAVLRTLGMARVRDAIAAHARGEIAARRSAEVLRGVRERIDWKVEAIAHDLGISVNYAQRLRKRLRDETKGKP